LLLDKRVEVGEECEVPGEDPISDDDGVIRSLIYTDKTGASGGTSQSETETKTSVPRIL
jgi:hypothetical protein